MKYLFFKELKEPESLNKCKPMEAIFSLELLKLVQLVSSLPKISSIFKHVLKLNFYCFSKQK